MKNQDFTFSLQVEETPAEAFNIILNVRQWWSGLYEESFDGQHEKTGDEFSFHAGGGAHYSRQKLIELNPNSKLVWLVTESNLSFVSKTDEWVGTKLSFEIFREPASTNILFTHIGLVPAMECYHSCAPAWTHYMEERLSSLLTRSNR